MPRTSTSPSSSTSTVTSSVATGGPSTTTTTAESAEADEVSTSKTDNNKPGNTFDGIEHSKPPSVLSKRIEEGKQNQAFTLFAPLGMSEDLVKIQFTLCNDIKAELQALKESVTAIPFTDLKNKATEATTNLE